METHISMTSIFVGCSSMLLIACPGALLEAATGGEDSLFICPNGSAAGDQLRNRVPVHAQFILGDGHGLVMGTFTNNMIHGVLIVTITKGIPTLLIDVTPSNYRYIHPPNIQSLAWL